MLQHEENIEEGLSMGDQLDARVARLEASVSHIERDITEIKTDLRLLLGALIVAVLGLAGLMAKGFHWL